MKKFEIIPSILNANFMHLKEQLTQLKENNIDWIHYDVMDYDFVPNLTFGAKILKDIVNELAFKVDIHFMVKVKTSNFNDFFNDYIKLKPQMMTMHIESMNEQEIEQFFTLCENNQIAKSLAIKPDTAITVLEPYLTRLDNILVMSVEPGFGGQKFLNQAAKKIQSLKTLAKNRNYSYSVEVDGGINQETIKIVKAYQVDKIVVGSYLFEQMQLMKKTLESLNND